MRGGEQKGPKNQRIAAMYVRQLQIAEALSLSCLGVLEVKANESPNGFSLDESRINYRQRSSHRAVVNTDI